MALPVHAQQTLQQDGQWRGGINAGFSEATGNTNSTSFNAAANVAWATQTDKFTADLTGLYGTNTNDDGTKSQSNNLVRFNTEYDHDLTYRVYLLGTGALERNELQDLNFRAQVAGGAGYHVIKTPTNAFNVFSGVSYNYEIYQQSSRNYPELLFGEDWNRQFNSIVGLTERFAIYPNLGYPGRYRTELDAGLTVALNSHLNLKLTLSNRYQNKPIDQVKKMDTLFVTSIGYVFGPK